MKLNEKGSFTKILNDNVEEIVNEVGLSTAMVYYMIKRHKITDTNIHCCYPSNADLAKECGLKTNYAVQKHINKLVNAGWLKVNSGGDNLGKNSNYYFPKEIGMYSESELNYISKIERRSTKKDTAIFEEVPAQNNEIIEDNNIPS